MVATDCAPALSNADVRDMLHRALREMQPSKIETPYRKFFLDSVEGGAGPAGYRRALNSDLEAIIIGVLLQHRNRSTMASVGNYAEALLQQQPELGAVIYTPLIQALEVYAAYTQALRFTLANWENATDILYAEDTLPDAAHFTAKAFGEIALHEIYKLAGGNAEASEQHLLEGATFRQLRDIYGVHISAISSNLNDWRIGLLSELNRTVMAAEEITAAKLRQKPTEHIRLYLPGQDAQ